jgi:formate hydrogenlyase subunit 4
MNSGAGFPEIAFLVSLPFIALLAEGISRKITARMQRRKGPPSLQPIYDIQKLISKDETDAVGEKSPFFRLSPYFILLSTLALFLFFPYPLLSFKSDFIFLIYLTVLSSALYVLSGIASDSPFATIGVMREITLMVCYEITLVVTIVNLAVFYGIEHISSPITGTPLLDLPLSFIALLVVAMTELKITPFDAPEAGSEIMAGAHNEYSGRKLAVLEMAHFLKVIFFILLLVLFTTGFSNPVNAILASAFYLFFLTLMHATTPRLKVRQAFRFLLGVLFLALLDFVRISYVIK